MTSTTNDVEPTTSATDELRRLLDERGVKHTDAEDGHTQYTWWSDGDHEIAACNSGERLAVYNLTPEQAIAATLGNRTDLSKRLREVYGLHAFAELFGFDWTDGSDWDWHDVACAMADAVDAATVRTGTCHIDVRNGDWYCDACGEMVGTCDPASELFIDGNAIDMWKYCPFCGRRIEQ